MVSWRHYTARLVLLGVLLLAFFYMWGRVIAPLQEELRSQSVKFEQSVETVTTADQELVTTNR